MKLMDLKINRGAHLAAAEFSLYLRKAPDELKRIHKVVVQCLEQMKEKNETRIFIQKGCRLRM
jgi:hypothetical protein